MVPIGFYFLWQKVGKIKKEEKLTQPTMANEQILKNKKVAMVVASENFRDEEYFVPKEILEKEGAEIKTVSDKTGAVRGADGGSAKADLLVQDVNPAEFDAVIFIGGPGALKHLDNEDSYKLARAAVEQEKILGAICVSPVILAKAGVLKGKKATVWSSALDKSSVKILKENGANYADEDAIVDGKIITAHGPSSAKEFGEKISSMLR
jgi:protease I